MTGTGGSDVFENIAANLVFGGSGTAGTVDGYSIITDFTPGTGRELAMKPGGCHRGAPR